MMRTREASGEDLRALGELFDAYRQFYRLPTDREKATGYLRDLHVLYDLYVSPHARRLGIGGALLEAAADRSRREGKLRMTLSTARTNVRAQALYASLGWKRDDEFQVYNLDLV
jgi:ribosomal protein S18 acetylase RimI-like enzyme